MRNPIPIVCLGLCLALGTGAIHAEDAKDAKTESAAKIAALMVRKESMAKVFDRVVKVAMDSPMAGELSVAQKKENTEKANSLKSNLLGMLPWDKVRENMAAEYAKRFTAGELQEILAFYEKGAGKKLLEVQPDLMVGMAERMINTMTEEKLTIAAARNLMLLEEKLEGKAKAAILRAKEAEAFPAKSLLGRWYGIDLKDPDMKSYWWHEKNADGTNTTGGLDLDAEEKSYVKYKDTGNYVVMGRLLIETDSESPEFSTFFILEKVTKESLVYLLVDEESPMNDWERVIDQKETIAPPKIPEGYKEDSD